MSSTLIKTLLAVLCILVALGVGLPLMLISETHTATDGQLGSIYTMSSDAIRDMSVVSNMINNGLKPYFLGFGLILFLCAVAFILVDGEDKLAILQNTDHDTPA